MNEQRHIYERILRLFQAHPDKAYCTGDIRRELDLPPQIELLTHLKRMCLEGKAERVVLYRIAHWQARGIDAVAARRANTLNTGDLKGYERELRSRLEAAKAAGR